MAEQSSVTVERGTDTTFVTLNEERIVEPAQIASLSDAILPVAEDLGERKLVLNFGNVQFMSSAVLGLVIRIHKKVAEQGGRLEIWNLEPKLRQVFEITRLTEILDIV